MGKSDFKRVGEQWNGSDNNRAALDEFYTSEAASTGKRKSKRKAAKKADHKHTYEDVILTFSNGKYLPCKGRRCTICAKVELIGFFHCKDENNHTVLMNYDDVIAAYPDMPIVEGDWL